MEYRKVTAIINSERLESVEQALLAYGVQGISIGQVTGFGEYRNFYKRDMLCRHVRIEIYCQAEEADVIAHCIMNAAHTGIEGDGLVAVLPVEHLYRIRTKKEVGTKE